MRLTAIFISTFVFSWAFILMGTPPCLANDDEISEQEEVSEEIGEGEQEWGGKDELKKKEQEDIEEASLSEDNKLRELYENALEKLQSAQNSDDPDEHRRTVTLAGAFSRLARLQIDPKKKLSYIKQAITVYEKATQLKPSDYNSRLQIGFYLLVYNLDIQRARQEFLKVLDYKPGNKSALMKLLRTYLRTSEYEKALGILNEVDRLFSDKPYIKALKEFIYPRCYS